MTRKEKINVLEWYCDHCGDTCDTCELKNIYDNQKQIEAEKNKMLKLNAVTKSQMLIW